MLPGIRGRLATRFDDLIRDRTDHRCQRSGRRIVTTFTLQTDDGRKLRLRRWHA